MQFEEKLAKEIAEKHGISFVTIRVWKLRGEIPDRYASETNQSGRVADGDPDLKKIIGIFAISEIAETCFSVGQKGSDIGKKKDRLFISERDEILSEIAEIRRVLSRAIRDTSRPNLRAVCEENRVNGVTLFGRDLYARIVGNDRLFDLKNEKAARECCIKLYNKLK